MPAYFTGEFGTGIDTDISYFLLILVASSDRQEFRLTTPYLSIHTSEPVSFIGGEFLPAGPGASTEQSGLGDIVAQEEVFFLRGDRRRPWISGSVRIKFPTADESQGLGTGEADYGPGVAIIQPVGERWTLFASAQYVFRGDPPGIDYRNTAWFTVGAQARLPRSSSLNLVYETRQSVLSDRPDIDDLSLGYDRRFSPGVGFRSAVYVGLSDTAEDYGLSLGLSFSPQPHQGAGGG